MRLTIPAELWGLITHNLLCLWGLFLAGGAHVGYRKRNHKPVTRCCLSTFAWIFPTISAMHFLAFAFLAITFWSRARMRHNRNRRPYELRICDICDWHTVEDEEHNFAGLFAWTSCQPSHTAPPAGVVSSQYVWRGFFEKFSGTSQIRKKKKDKKLRRQWKPLPTLINEKDVGKEWAVISTALFQPGLVDCWLKQPF